MDRKLRLSHAIAIGFLFYFGLSVGVTSGQNRINQSHNKPANYDRQKLMRMAVMPPENFTGNLEAAENIFPLLLQSLTEAGYQLIPYEDTYAFLLRHRLREKGSVTRSTARRIGKEFGADSIILFSLNLYEEEGDMAPALGFSLKMVSTADGKPFWARNFSYAGKDFEGLFQVGAISFLDKLIEISLKEARKSYPKDIPSPPPLPPFELDKISYHKWVKGGDKVDILARFIPIGRLPEQVDIILDGQQKTLSEGGRDTFEGELIAPAKEGLYSLDFVCLDKNKRWDIIAGEYLEVDNTLPKPEISIGYLAISPNGDGQKDGTPIFLMDLSPGGIKNWRFAILNAQKKKLAQVGGRWNMPPELYWNGINEYGERLEDGNYYLQLEVEDMAGNKNIAPLKSIIVDTIPPVFSLDGFFQEVEHKRSLRLSLTAQDGNHIEDWKVVFRDDKGFIIKEFTGKEIPPTSITWETGLPSTDQLVWEMEVRDIADNIQTASGQIVKGIEPVEERKEEEEKAPEEVEFE